MYIYQFIKYNNATTFEHLLKYAKSGAVICFDFEDSICNWLKTPQESSEIKKYYRNCFKTIATTIAPGISDIKIGVRLNSDFTELSRDLNAISNLKIQSVIIPKVSNPEQLLIADKSLNDANVAYDELIPIIESKSGLSGFQEIISSVPQKIRKVAFGHCDYNLSINAFPFFHQDSCEYWKWADRMCSFASDFGITYINSVFLQLGNDSFFRSMLNHLNKLCGENFGQATLTSRQSELCNTYKKFTDSVPFTNLIDNRLDVKGPENYAKAFIRSFEDENKNRGFTIIPEEKRFLSPQEYSAARHYLTSGRLKKINLTFVGGCFPVQDNILFEDLFHQVLKREIESRYKIGLNFNIIRYERFDSCMKKISGYNRNNPINILIFHIRPEPFLRLVKFYYKYSDNNGKIKRSFTIPFLSSAKPEKYDLLILNRRFNSRTKTNDSKFHKFLINFNYRTGSLLGNELNAQRKFLNLINNVVDYCKSSRITPVLLGPALRTNTSYEPILCMRLNNFIKSSLENSNTIFINGTDVYTDKNEPLFHFNGILANEKYHELIGERICRAIKPHMEKLHPF